MSFHRLDLVCRGIESFEGLKSVADNNFVVLNVQGNFISDFEGFGTHPYMARLDVRGNSIKSFYGLTRQRSLQSLDLRGNPIATHPFYRIMALMVVGFSLTHVDEVPITPEERTLARRGGTDAAMAVSFGWLLDMKPRTPEAYKSIIAECKRVHAGVRGTAPRKTLSDALAELGSSGNSQQQPPRGLVSTGSNVDTASRRTIERLAKRVATLEQMVQEASAETVAESTAVMLGYRTHDPLLMEYLRSGAVVGNGGALAPQSAPISHGSVLTEHEVRGASTILFTDGISTRSNQGAHNQTPRRSCLQLSRRALTVLNFMTRSPTFELKLSGSLSVSYRRPQSLLVENRFGVALEITFEDFDVLCTVFKLLFLLRGKPAPPPPTYQSGTQSDDGRVQASAPSQRTVSEESEVNVSEDGREEEAGFEISQTKKTSAPSAPLPASTAFTSKGATAQPAAPAPAPERAPTPLFVDLDSSDDAAEDNITDIPPLPSPGGASRTFQVGTPSVNAGVKSASDISFRVEGPVLGSARASDVADAAPNAPPPAPPKPPARVAVVPRRFQNLAISSSDSDDGQEQRPAPAPSLPPSRTAPPPRPPTVPLRRTVSGDPLPSASSVPPKDTGAAGGVAGDAPQRGGGQSLTASSIQFVAEPAAAPASRGSANHSNASPLTSVRNSAKNSVPASAVGAAGSARNAERSAMSSVKGSVAPSPRSQPLPTSVPAAAPLTPPGLTAPTQPSAPAGGGRFASLMVDSDSDSDA